MQKLIASIQTLVLFGVAFIMAASASAQAVGTDAPQTSKLEAEKKSGVAVGDSAPKWEDLEGTDGEQHSLEDLQDAKAVLVVFTCNHCPVAQAYEDRLIALHEDYAKKGVEVVAINVNNLKADRLPAMKERAEEKGFEFAYLYDPTQEIGRAYGATVTPHAFLLDGERKVVYLGAIDDNMDAKKATEHHVRDALDAVLENEAVENAQTNQFGCAIKYE